jgi:hypothetical protein
VIFDRSFYLWLCDRLLYSGPCSLESKDGGCCFRFNEAEEHLELVEHGDYAHLVYGGVLADLCYGPGRNVEGEKLVEASVLSNRRLTAFDYLPAVCARDDTDAAGLRTWLRAIELDRLRLRYDGPSL